MLFATVSLALGCSSSASDEGSGETEAEEGSTSQSSTSAGSTSDASTSAGPASGGSSEAESSSGAGSGAESCDQGQDDGPTSDGTTDDCPSDESSTTDAPPAGGHCDLSQETGACDLGDPPIESFFCDSPAMCDEVLFGEDEAGDRTLDNPEAATCVLEALRDGVRGTFEISFDAGTLQPDYVLTRLEALGDGTIVNRSESFFDECGEITETWVSARDAAYFEDCLSQTEPEAIYMCLIQAGDADQCVAADPECPS